MRNHQPTRNDPRRQAFTQRPSTGRPNTSLECHPSPAQDLATGRGCKHVAALPEVDALISTSIAGRCRRAPRRRRQWPADEPAASSVKRSGRAPASHFVLWGERRFDGSKRRLTLLAVAAGTARPANHPLHRHLRKLAAALRRNFLAAAGLQELAYRFSRYA